MTFAAVDGTGYQILLVLHIIAAIIAFAPAVAHPLMDAQSRKGLDPDSRSRVLGFMAANTQRIYGSALVVAGILGFGLVGMSDDVYEMSEAWIIAAIIIWVVMTGIVHAVLSPAERRAAAGDAASEKVVRSMGGLLTLLGIVTIYLMVFQPGQ